MKQSRTRNFFIYLLLAPIVVYVLNRYKHRLFAFILYFLNSPAIGVLGVLNCFLLPTIGTVKGITSISTVVSGTAILIPTVWARSTIGTLVCEGNLVVGLIITMMLASSVDFEGTAGNQMLEITEDFNFGEEILKLNNTKNVGIFCLGTILGFCSYYSSISAGLLCSAITIVDGKDPKVFSKVAIFELLAGSYGIIGMTIVLAIKSKFFGTK